MIHLNEWVGKASRARRAAHAELARHEASSSRVVLLEDLAKRLSGEPIDVQDYFNEAIACLEGGLRRSAIVLAWSGQFHVLSEMCFQRHGSEIRTARPAWTFRDLNELKENATEAEFLKLAKHVKFINKAELRILDGHLAHRNQCAHPTLYRPSLNAAIGYVDEMITQTIKYLNS